MAADLIFFYVHIGIYNAYKGIYIRNIYKEYIMYTKEYIWGIYNAYKRNICKEYIMLIKEYIWGI